jgi:hypothetical protein
VASIVGCFGGGTESKQTAGKKHMILATHDVVAVKCKKTRKSKQDDLGENR